MRNIDFNVGFMIDREKLDEYVNVETEYTSIFETSFGYQGVNIKIPLEVVDHTMKKKIFIDGKWVTEKITYNQFLEQVLTEKERKKEREKERYNTFLVFNSGNIIMSSMNKKMMRRYFDIFIDMVKENEKIFRDNFDVSQK
jgi:hypothetical protein